MSNKRNPVNFKIIMPFNRPKNAEAVKTGFTDGASQAYSAVIAENVGLIKSIPQEYLKRVEAEVWNTVAFGYDLEELTHSLVKIGNISYKRAGFIALDQSNKAKAIIEKQRREELGITEAIWQHSGGGKKPRHSHVKAGQDRLVFNVSKGAYIDGDWILPGELINCRCTSRAIIPRLKQSQ